MGDFVIDNLAPPTKSGDKQSVPVGQDPTKYISNVDWATICQALVDIRSFVKTGLTPGSYTNTSLTVDANGRITAATNGSAGLTAPVANASLATMAANTVKVNNTGGVATPVDVAYGPFMFGTDAANLTGSLAAARVPNNLITNAMRAQMTTLTMKGNNTGGTANEADLSVAQTQAMLGIIPNITAGPGWFGDGSDGAAVFDGASAVTGWTRVGSVYFPTSRPTWYFTTVTLSNGVILQMEVGGEGSGGGASSELYAAVAINVVSGTATIKHNGNTPTTNVVATNMTTGHNGGSCGQGAGGIQNAGQNGAAFSPGSWFNARKNGAGGFGGASLTAAGSTIGGVCNTILADAAGLLATWEQAKQHRLNMSSSGNTGGGGGGGSGAGTVGIASGGAGGNGGGIMTVGSRQFLVTGSGTITLQVKGGNGAPGVGGAGSNTGGGSGGGGGEITVGVGTNTLPGGVTVDASGGTGGAPAGGGSAGGNGVAGQKYIFCLGPG